MGYAKWREEFVARMVGRYGWPLAETRAVLRHAGVIQRGAEVDCSVSSESIRAQHAKASQKAEDALVALAPTLSARFEVQGDPRGCCVKVWPKGYDYEEGIGVPAEGYRASQIERMG